MEYLLVLFAALLHASWNGLLKHSTSRVVSLSFNRLVGVVLGVCLIAYLPPLEIQAWPYLLIACAVHIIYFFSLISAYQHGDFSQVYPLSRGVAPVIILIAGWLWGTDHLGRYEILGIIIICLGIILLAGRLTSSDKHALFFAGITACCIAGYTLASGMGVRQASHFLTYAAWLETLSGLGFIIIATIRYGHQQMWQDITFSKVKWDMLSGLLATGGFAVALWAMSTIPIATVAALRESSVVFAAIIAWLFLNERYGIKRIIASTMVFLGIVVLLLGKQITLF
ncbi:EamA family transporter [Ningiella sp. W23]|uniref:EamA family transporter n=1 Tax=Ningiella sp. W23 TaxID=3023715 RepID=UPI003757327F